MTKPVRKVKSNGRTITGTFASPKTGKQIQFESYLEYAFIEILEFDSEVIDISDQPLVLKYEYRKVESIHYPDFLVEYSNRKPVIFSVKYQSEVDKDVDGKIARDLKAGKRYAKTKKCTYRIITDKEILTIYTENVDELLKVRSESPNLKWTTKLINALSEVKVSTPNTLIQSITDDRDEQAVLLRQLRILILNRRISVNMFSRIKANSPIWLNRKNDFKELNFPYKIC